MTAGGSTLSRFTPSLMSHELLERLFVARERTLEAIMARIDAAADSAERNHTLLVGPRGAGKTHLVSLVYHRVNELREAGAALQVAWLPEDPWTLVSYRHLLAAVAERLEPSVDGDLPRSAEELEALLAASAATGGPIVVLVENLDQILEALADDGQQRLRHLLQADRSLLLVATSTRLDRALSDQASPFYGFFTTTRLEPFDVDEAAAMLTAIAEERKDQKLVDYLASAEGRARLRTISHLAGGQPRMWAALASALTVGGLDELVELLLTRFDDLTPYYQEQLGRLSGQQRLVVAELAEVDRPINVSELAERLEIDQRSLGKTMSDLVDRGWAAATTSPVTKLLDQRRTYYELAEPMARLSFQIKESRGEPLRLVVEFLKHWFDPKDLGESETVGITAEYLVLATKGHESDPVVAVTRRLQRLPVTRAPAVALLGEIDDALSALATGDPDLFLRLPMPVRAALEQQLEGGDTAWVRMDIHTAAQEEFGHTRHPAMEPWIARAEGLVTASGEDMTSLAQLSLIDWLGRAWRFDEAKEVLVAAISERGPDDVNVLDVRASVASSCWAVGRFQEAVDQNEAVLKDQERILGPDDLATLATRSNLAACLSQVGRAQEAIDLLHDTLADRERILGADHVATLDTRSNLAIAYWGAQRTAEAIELGEAVIEDCQRVLGQDDPDTLLARANLATYYWQAGRAADAIDHLESVLADQHRVLGPDDPTTLATRSNLSSAYAQAQRMQEAIELAGAVLADQERILGPDHPETLKTRASLAVDYWHAGDAERAIGLAEAVLTDEQRVLGLEHPSTIALSSAIATMRQALKHPRMAEQSDDPRAE